MRCGNAEARPFLYVIISGAPWRGPFLYAIISGAPKRGPFLHMIISEAPRLFLFLYILYIVYRKLCPAAAGIWILPKIMTGATLIAVALPFGVALLAGPVLLFTELLNRSVDKRRAADMRR